MKWKNYRWALALSFGMIASLVLANQPSVEWKADIKTIGKGRFELSLTGELPAGFHIYGVNPSGGEEATKVVFESQPGPRFEGELRENQTTDHFEADLGTHVKWHIGNVTLSQSIVWPEASPRDLVYGKIYYQLCSSTVCLPPTSSEFSAPFPAATSTRDQLQASNASSQAAARLLRAMAETSRSLDGFSATVECERQEVDPSGRTTKSMSVAKLDFIRQGKLRLTTDDPVHWQIYCDGRTILMTYPEEKKYQQADYELQGLHDLVGHSCLLAMALIPPGNIFAADKGLDDDPRLRTMGSEFVDGTYCQVVEYRLTKSHYLTIYINSDNRPAKLIQGVKRGDGVLVTSTYILRAFHARESDWGSDAEIFRSKIPPGYHAQEVYTDKLTPIGTSAPTFALTDVVTGERVDLSRQLAEKKGGLLMFWSLGCEGCRRSLPALQRLFEQHGKELAVITVDDLDQGSQEQEMVREYARHHHMSMPILLDGSRDVNGRAAMLLAKEYHLDPGALVLIDAKGVVRWSGRLRWPPSDQVWDTPNLAEALQGIGVRRLDSATER